MAKAKKKVDVGEPQIALESLTELRKRFAPENPKKHALELIGESYREHGAVEMPGIDEKTGLLYAGHGRVEELLAMKEAGEEPPARVVVKDGEWFMPVVRGMAFKNRRALTKYLLTQRIGEVGGYDNAAVAKILASLDGDLAGTGVREKEMVSFLAKAGSGVTAAAGDQSKGLKQDFTILIECASEKQQLKLLNRFAREGLKCRALT